MQVGADITASAVAEQATKLIGARTRTIWDARRLLRPVIGQTLQFVYDDGQHALVQRSGVLLDVIHTPHLGYTLKVKGLLPAHDRSGGRSDVHRRLKRVISTLPISILRRPVPKEIRFLLDPPQDWPLPEPWVACAQCGHRSSGRFCTACGAKIRTTHHLGEGFTAEQVILRGLDAAECQQGCGAVIPSWATHCGKCGASASIG